MHTGYCLTDFLTLTEQLLALRYLQLLEGGIHAYSFPSAHAQHVEGIFLDQQYPLNLLLHLSIPAFSLRRGFSYSFLGKEEVVLFSKWEEVHIQNVRAR